MRRGPFIFVNGKSLCCLTLAKLTLLRDNLNISREVGGTASELSYNIWNGFYLLMEWKREFLSNIDIIAVLLTSQSKWDFIREGIMIQRKRNTYESMRRRFYVQFSIVTCEDWFPIITTEEGEAVEERSSLHTELQVPRPDQDLLSSPCCHCHCYCYRRSRWSGPPSRTGSWPQAPSSSGTWPGSQPRRSAGPGARVWPRSTSWPRHPVKWAGTKRWAWPPGSWPRWRTLKRLRQHLGRSRRRRRRACWAWRPCCLWFFWWWLAVSSTGFASWPCPRPRRSGVPLASSGGSRSSPTWSSWRPWTPGAGTASSGSSKCPWSHQLWAQAAGVRE